MHCTLVKRWFKPILRWAHHRLRCLHKYQRVRMQRGSATISALNSIIYIVIDFEWSAKIVKNINNNQNAIQNEFSVLLHRRWALNGASRRKRVKESQWISDLTLSENRLALKHLNFRIQHRVSLFRHHWLLPSSHSRINESKCPRALIGPKYPFVPRHRTQVESCRYI